MAQRRIGQDVFRFGAKAERQTTLDELGALIDWSLADSVLAALCKARKGEKGWPSWVPSFNLTGSILDRIEAPWVHQSSE